MVVHFRKFGQVIFCIFFFLVSGCGGSGSGGGTETSQNPTPPVAPIYLTYSKSREYKISYPSDWNSPGYSEEPDVIGEFYSPNGDAAVLLLKVIGDIKQSDPDLAAATVISSQAISVGGIPALEEILDVNISNGDGSFDKASLMLTSFLLNGLSYGVAYISAPEKFNVHLDIARHMTQSLNVTQAIFANLGATSERPATATDGENFLVVTCNHPAGYSNPGTSSLIGKIIYHDRSTSTQIDIANEYVLPEFTVHPCSYEPSIASDGNDFLVAYASAGEIYAKRIRLDGSVIDVNPILVSVGEETNTAVQPEVVFDGSQFFVVWYSGSASHQLLGAKISLEGLVSTPVVLQDVALEGICEVEPHIALGKDNLMVMWSQSLCMGFLYYSPRTLFTQLYDFNGNALREEAFELRATGPDLVFAPQITSGDDNYLVSWVGGEIRSTSLSEYIQNPAIFGVRISHDGFPLDDVNGGVVVTSRTGWSASSADLSLNFRDGRYFFAWSRGYFAGDFEGIHGLSVNQGFSAAPAVNPSSLNVLAPENSYPFGKTAMSFSNDQSLLIAEIQGTLYGWYFSLDGFD